ncbi:MAG TPA: TIGR03084 family protein, partial [Acidimicrobiaceae bacterium]|nr:TIGR03084 family protein [Acidimicrobiaceae bacterium]
MDAICDDLLAETDALAHVLADRTDDEWRAPTPAQGWDSRDTVVHLGMTDWVATLATADPDEFEATKAGMAAGEADLHTAAGFDFESMSGADLWAWFDSRRTTMVAAFRRVGPRDRIPWFGPDMG